MYIGQTARPIKTRLNEHKSQIKRHLSKIQEVAGTVLQVKNKLDEGKKPYGETSIARHFAEAKHNVTDIRWQVIEEINVDAAGRERRLLQREAYWIMTLETLAPLGLNEECKLSVFL